MKVLFAMILLLAVQPTMAAEVHTVPLDIREHFKKNNCSEVTNYYLESRVIEKPYLYGVRSAITGNKFNNDYSFIAWCKSNNINAVRQYVLVGQLDSGVWPGGCKLPIRDFDYAGGLSVTIKKVDLSKFRDLSHKNSGRGSAHGPVIRSEKDGLVYEVFCHRGSWVKHNVD